jgi:hypothetical protein
MWHKARFVYSALGFAILLISLPTISDGIAGWAAWLHWLGEGDWQWALPVAGLLIIVAANLPVLVRRGGLTGMPAAVPPETEGPQTVEHEPTAAPVERRYEPEPVPGEISVADLPAPAAQAFAEMTRRGRVADLVVTRVELARELRAAFDDFIETFLARRAEYVAQAMTTERLEQAREEYGRLHRRAVRACRAVRDYYRRFLDDEPQYDRGSPDPDYYVAKEWLADWWSPLTFDAALDKYASADDEHLRRYIGEERAILEAFAEWIAEPRHHEFAGDLAGANLEDEEIVALVQRQLGEREQQAPRHRATLSARPGATSGREYADEYNFDVMNSGPATALRVRAWAARADGTRATAPADLYTLPSDNRWTPLRLEIPRQFSDTGGLRLLVSWQDEAGEHEEPLLEIRPLR